MVSTAGRGLARLLARSDPTRALAVYDHVRLHLGEIENNARFRREEVRVLAGSTYPLRVLGNPAEARHRLDDAFESLRNQKLYPVDRVELGSEAEEAVRALADAKADSGNVAEAIEVYQELLEDVLAAQPAYEDALDDAADLSRLYASLAALHRQAGDAERASSMDARRLQLWQHWDRKLPDHPFVRRKLSEIGGS
jgi:hypothetical protein